jgi:hypothetical protein
MIIIAGHAAFVGHFTVAQAIIGARSDKTQRYYVEMPLSARYVSTANRSVIPDTQSVTHNIASYVFLARCSDLPITLVTVPPFYSVSSCQSFFGLAR